MNSEAIQRKNNLSKLFGFTSPQKVHLVPFDSAECRNSVSPRNDALSGSFRLPFTVYHLPRFAFTLAEVLITLVVIGVVASMTIPALINNYQKNQTVTKLQKAFSTISNAYKMAEGDYGTMQDWDDPGSTVASSVAWYNKYSIIPYLSVVTACTGPSGCWASNAEFLDGTGMTLYSTLPYIILNDGTAIYFAACYTDVANPLNTDAVIYFDINGLKAPNIAGKDIFCVYVRIRRGKVEFAGTDNSRTWMVTTTTGYGCNKNSGTRQGEACGGLIQKDGWKISNDYPWN